MDVGHANRCWIFNPDKNHLNDEAAEYLSALFLIESNYDLVFKYPASSYKQVIGTREGKKKCRFCGREEPATTFRKRAHVVPESFGNRRLLSAHECDECNQRFGNSFENDFGEYFLPYRALGRIRGKNGFCTLKDEKRGWRIDAAEGGLNVEHRSDDAVIEHRISENEIIFNIPRQPYTPIEVYKCFLRIAFTALPDEEVHHFEEHLSWLGTPNNKVPVAISPSVFETFLFGEPVFQSPAIMLFRRKLPDRCIPYMMCVVASGNTLHQFYLPSTPKDSFWIAQSSTLPLLPAHPRCRKLGQIVTKLDFSGRDKVSGDLASLGFKYQDRIEILGES